MTAVRKPDGGVRGIATGTVFRRHVAKCLSRQYISEVEKVCAPYQFAMSTRAGADCVGHAVRAMTDLNPRTTVTALVQVARSGEPPWSVAVRQECLFSTFHVPLAGRGWDAACDPTVRGWGNPSCCLAVHDALAEVKEQLQDGEVIFAFLDDVYALCAPERA